MLRCDQALPSVERVRWVWSRRHMRTVSSGYRVLLHVTVFRRYEPGQNSVGQTPAHDALLVSSGMHTPP